MPANPTNGNATPLEENAQTVRERIIDEVNTRVATLASVGSVIEPGDDDSMLAAAMQAGKHAIEIVVGNDETTEPSSSVEAYRLPVELVAFLPPTTGVDAPTMATQASRIKAEIYLLLCATDDARTLNGLAVNTVPAPISGGGVFLDTQRNLYCTIVGFDIDYRHTRGNPTEAR